MKKIIYFVIVIVFLLSGIFGTAWYKNREINYLKAKINNTETDLTQLRKHLKDVESRSVEPTKSEFSVGLSNAALAKMEQAFLPMKFNLEKEFSGVVTLESFHDIHFLSDNQIQFIVEISGADIRYERKLGIFDFLRDNLVINSFSASGDCTGKIKFDANLPGLEIKIEVRKLTIQKVPPFFEELVIKQLNNELNKNPQRIKFRIKPQEIELGQLSRQVQVIPRGLVVSGTQLILLNDVSFADAQPSKPAEPFLRK
jgi:hypothetical protein